MDLPSRLDLLAIGRDYVQRSSKIDPAQIDVLGSDVNIVVGSNSMIADALIKQLGYSIANQFLDGAKGDDLARLAYDRYGLTSKGASAALTTCEFSRTSIANGGGTIASGTTVTTLTGIEYVLVTNASFSGSDLTSSADVRAVQAGKLTQVAATTLVKFQNPSALFDSTIAVTNLEGSAGGEEAEDDDTFKARIRNFWNSARRGVMAAIETGALTVPGVVSANAIEALTTDGNPARVVNLYISDSSGVASRALARKVETALLEYRAGGIAVLVSTSQPFIVAVQLFLQFQGGVDTVTLSDLIRSTVVSFINSLPVNGALLISDLFATLQQFTSDGLVVSQNTLVSPIADLIPTVGQTFRTTLDQVTLVSG